MLVRSGLWVLAALASMCMWHGASAHAADARPNVLFIAIDDLNDWVHHLGGHPQTVTPHIDALAARGVTLTNAHCAAPVCNPSRAALMSGLRPSTTGVYGNAIDWRKHITETDTIPMHFRKQGYYVAGAGKIYHERWRRASDWDEYSEEPNRDLPPAAGSNAGVGGIRFAPVDGDDAEMHDYHTVDWIAAKLAQKHDKPFFLACGLHKPHMSWNVPKKYYDMYPLDSIVLPKVLEGDLDDVPPAGVKMAKPDGDHKDILDSGRWKDAVQGYLAACTFADQMVGRMVEALDRSAYGDNTIIVLWGDHGWHLGEKQHWRKFTLWEEATRAPLMYVVPGVTKAGGVCTQPVDFMSIYPTLCDLCGISTPAHVEGVSIKPLLAGPNAAWNLAAVTTHGRGNHTARTATHRYIRYADGSEELYDHTADPMEWKNLAADSQYASLKSELAAMLPTINVPTPEDDGVAESTKRPATKKARNQQRRRAKN